MKKTEKGTGLRRQFFKTNIKNMSYYTGKKPPELCYVHMETEVIQEELGISTEMEAIGGKQMIKMGFEVVLSSSC